MSVAIHYEQLRNAALFKELSDDVLLELARHCRYMELHAGETLFNQGDPGDGLYILEEGQIHVVRKYADGEEVILATEGPYYAVGELSMLVGQPRTGGVVAVSDCTLIALDRQAFMAVCERIPEIATRVQLYLGKRLYRMNLMVREHAIGDVAARVASIVMLLSGGNNGLIPNEIRIHRVARAAACEAEAVNRLFHQWRNQGWITFDERALTVKNIEAIHNLAG